VSPAPPPPADVNVNIAGIEAFKDLLGSVANLARVLGTHSADLPPDVLDAVDDLRVKVARAGGPGFDIGPVPR